MRLQLLLFLCLFTKNEAKQKKKDSSNGLNYLVLGDWGGFHIKEAFGGYTTPDQVAIAEQMGIVGENVNSQFTMALGDNFYIYGVQNDTDSRFDTTFENVYTHQSLQSRWYVICGNHDYYGQCSAEIQYTKRSSRWYFPDYYYDEVFKIPGTKGKIRMAVLFIDTIILGGRCPDSYLPSESDLPDEYNCADTTGPVSQKIASGQWEWIEEKLEEYSTDSSIKWIVVVGHYPVLAAGSHGPFRVVSRKLKPLLQKYNVDAYFCGHEHNLEHLRHKNVDYYVVGAGAFVDHNELNEDELRVPKDSLKYFYGIEDVPEGSKFKGGFAHVNVTESKMTVRFIDAEGRDLYSFARDKSKKSTSDEL